MKNNTQPALKERIEKALDDFTKGRASMHVPPLDTDVDMVLAECSDRLSKLEARCAALAAENAGLKAACGGDGSYRDCPACAHSEYIEAPETPATDAFLAEVRASAIPDGYVLVPQEMHLSSEAMEGICFHCGDGGFAFGEFTDGLLFVGAIDDSDGQKIHGLHIATADYPEEGCATICAFLPAPTEGAAQ